MRVQTPVPDALTSITDALLHGQGEADVRRAMHNAPAEAQHYTPMLRRLAVAYTPVEPEADFLRDLKTELMTGKPRPVRQPKAAKRAFIPRIHPAGWAFAGGFATLGVVLLVLRGIVALFSRGGQRPPMIRPTGQ